MIALLARLHNMQVRILFNKDRLPRQVCQIADTAFRIEDGSPVELERVDGRWVVN